MIKILLLKSKFPEHDILPLLSFLHVIDTVGGKACGTGLLQQELVKKDRTYTVRATGTRNYHYLEYPTYVNEHTPTHTPTHTHTPHTHTQLTLSIQLYLEVVTWVTFLALNKSTTQNYCLLLTKAPTPM